MCDRATVGVLLALLLAGMSACAAAEPAERGPLWSAAVPEPEPDCVESVHLYLDNRREDPAGYARAEIGERRCGQEPAPGPETEAALTEEQDIAVVREPGVRGAWVWRQEVWANDPGPLIERAQATGLSRLYVAVAIVDGAVERPGALSELIARANEDGLRSRRSRAIRA